MDFGDISTIGTLVVGFSIVSLAIWNASKKVSQVEQTQEEQDRNQTKEITNLNDKVIKENQIVVDRISKVETDATAKIYEQKAEHKEAITKAIINQHERLQVQQDQINSVKIELKDLSTQVTVDGTKTDILEKEVIKIQSNVKDVEDCVKETNKLIFKIIYERDQES